MKPTVGDLTAQLVEWNTQTMDYKCAVNNFISVIFTKTATNPHTYSNHSSCGGQLQNYASISSAVASYFQKLAKFLKFYIYTVI